MNISISPEQATFLDQQVARGAFANPQEAVAAAIDLLRRRADAVAKIDSGRHQLDEGDFTEYDEASLRSRFEELKGRLQQRRSRSSI
jgi:Arc/MetJ-type ribon-helix-helix transcriptional regulator